MSDSNYLTPGVYIQELEGPAPIVGVSTSIAAFIGMAERGPVNVPILCTSIGDYTRWFGGLMRPQEFPDPADPNRAHCYLPYAVSGFFNNVGQIAYVIRVVPDAGTNPAAEELFDRTGISANASVLVRNTAIGDGGGTTAATGALIMLAPVPPASTAATPSFIRVGDGSASEYVRITATTAVTDGHALDRPLRMGHASGVAFANYARATVAGAHVLAGDAAAGDTAILLSSPSTAAVIGASLIELSANGIVVAAVPRTVTATGANAFTVVLTQPLEASFAVASTALALLTPTAPVPGSVFDAAASAGDSIVYATGAGLAAGQVFDIDPANPATREVRTLGALTSVTFAQPATVDWPAGTELTRMAPSSTTLSSAPAPNPGATTIALTSRVGIYAGSVLSIDTGASRESATVLSVADPRASGADPGNVTLTVATANAHGAGTAVVVVSSATTMLSAAALTGARMLSLTSRLNIDAGSVLLVGTGPQSEYATVASIVGARTLGADPGAVALNTPLANGYMNNAPVVMVSLAAQPAVPAGTGNRATQLVLDTAPGSTVAHSTWSGGWGGGDIVRIALEDGEVSFNTVSALGAPTLEAVTVTPPVQGTHQAGEVVVSRSPLIEAQALDVGAWGNRLALAVQDESSGLVARAGVTALIGPTQVRLATLTGVQAGSYLELIGPAGLVDAATPWKVAAVELATATVTLDGPVSVPQTNAIAGGGTWVRSREFRMSVSLYRHPDPAVPSRDTQIIQSETFRNLSMDPRHAQYFEKVIGALNGPPRLSDHRPDGTSWLIRVLDIAPTQAPRLGPEPLTDTLPSGLVRPAQHRMTGGDDGLAQIADTMYIGDDSVDPATRTGIYVIQNAPNVSIVAIPGQGSAGIQVQLIDLCERLKSCFAILDPLHPNAAIADIQAQRQNFDTKYAAIYYPWLIIPDPMPANLALVPDFPVPPSGYVAGIYARVDVNRGVFHAPANEVVQGITGLTQTLNDGDQAVLNPEPNNINVIRDFRPRGRGIRVWGARVITSDDNYKYVPVRRLLIFIEQSMLLGLQDVVFEPNTPSLWASVERVIENFLRTVWASGALAGATPETSYFVRCDLTTMTPDDIDAGRLIVLVGVAPAMPAEFVIIQIALMTASASQ